MKVTAQRLADSIGVTKETIRHYRQMGLLHPTMRENGYYEYSVDDALRLMLAKEMQTYDMPLEHVRDSFLNMDIGTYNALLYERGMLLQRRVEKLELEIARMRETNVYVSCGVRILNKVEEFDGPATWAVGVLARKQGILEGRNLEKWVEHAPFTYVSATIPLEELKRRKGADPYDIEIGSGALIHYVDKFQLPLYPGAHFQPGGHFIRTCIQTKDILSICPDDIAPLLSYAQEKGYTFQSCTGGRLLFIEQPETTPLYYMLIWVLVARD